MVLDLCCDHHPRSKHEPQWKTENNDINRREPKGKTQNSQQTKGRMSDHASENDGTNSDEDDTERERLISADATNDDDDDDDDSDDDTTMDSTSSPPFLTAAWWREHSIAVAIAIVATILAYFLQEYYHDAAADPAWGRQLLARPSLHHGSPSLDHLPHRAANWTVHCDDTESSTTDNLSKSLAWMTVRIPAHLDAALERLLAPISIPACYFTDRRIRMPYYPTPTIDSMYPHDVAALAKQEDSTSGSLQPAHLTFTGFAAQFVNLSPEPVLLFWDHNSERQLVGELGASHRLTTATHAGASFSISPVHDPSTELVRWVVTEQDAVQYYVPTDARLQRKLESHPDLVERYEHALLHRVIAHDYLIHARRTYLGHVPRLAAATPMRPASYMGQTHTVTYTSTDGQRFVFEMTVVSVAPRVFTIENFLTAAECQELLREYESGSPTPTTTRSHDLTVQSIYDRTARLLQLPHLQHRVEPLQVLAATDSATPTHDWIAPPDGALHPHQPTRIASLHIALVDNNDSKLHFPRAVTKDRHDGVTITPMTRGTATLWYNVLPDGNMDDRAQVARHGGGAQVWVWDPYVV